jgi:hypothetical protein
MPKAKRCKKTVVTGGGFSEGNSHVLRAIKLVSMREARIGRICRADLYPMMSFITHSQKNAATIWNHLTFIKSRPEQFL